MALNVFGEVLQICSANPLTGFFRDGCCNTNEEDTGQHYTCVVVTSEFLAFSKSVGNDLSTSLPEFGFKGLKPGDKWCLCALRWVQAFEAGCAPKIFLEATHEKMLDHVLLEELVKFAFKTEVL